MRNSCSVCSLAVVLCLFVCVYANAEVTEEGAARAAVEQAKASVTAVHERAQSELDKAQSLLDKVESSKGDATDAKVKSQEAPQDNTDAVSIAKTIKSLSDEVDELYATEKPKLNNAVNTLTALLSDAETLNGKPDIKIEPNTDSAEDYSETSGKAAVLKADAAKLDGQIDTAIEPISGVDTIVKDVEQKAKQTQLKNAHVIAIVAVATIDTILGKAATIIGQIEGKKNAVSGIVGEMQTLKTNNPTVSDANIEALLERAANALKDATDALGNANSAKVDIQTQKGLADAVLTKVQPEIGEVSEAKQEVQKAEECVRAAQQSFSQLQSKLEIADNSLTNANNLNEQLQTALSTATRATRHAQSVTNPQVKQLQNSVRTAVNTIQSIMEEADGTLQETKNNKQTVHNIVEEMKKLSTAEFIEANQNIKMLYSKADDALADATGAVQKAEKAKRDITEQKEKADDALSSVATATDVETAQKEVNTANACVNQANQFAATLKSALQTAKDSVTNANDVKQKLQTALSTTTSKPGTEQSLTHSQVKTLQDSVNAAVTEMQTMMGEAVSTLQKLTNNKGAVHDIVQEMQTLKTTAKMESNGINELCKNAEGELTIVTGAVEKVKTEKESMRKEKVIADAALKGVNAATEIEEAKQQADTATSCLAKVKKNIVQVRIALQTAENSVEKANKLKKKLKTALSTTTTAPRTKEVKETEKADLPVGEGTESDVKDTKTQPTSKDPPSPSDNTSEEIKQTLINSAQNVPTTALTGGKAPAPDAKNDSAMTVSVPLLVALIASAVLQ